MSDLALQEYYINQNGKQVIRDKEKEAIDRLKGFEDMALWKSQDGYYVCDSGGKDSLVIVDLAIRSGVECTFHHNFTSCDHKITNKYVKDRQAEIIALGYDYTISYPEYKGKRTTIFRLIETKGLPTRLRRWCCEMIKEGGGAGRCIVTGVRWAESTNRKRRGQIETITNKKQDKVIRNNDNAETRQSIENCPNYQKLALNPIIDWSDAEVWEYIRKHNLKYNPLYDMGYTRVGCVGCPMSTKQKQELEANPNYYKAYYTSAEKYLVKYHERNPNKPILTVDKLMDWWASGNGSLRKVKDQISFIEKDNKL